MRNSQSGASPVVVVGLLAAIAFGLKGEAYADDGVKDANGTVAPFKKTDPGLTRFFQTAVGYAVFPSVGKGVLGLGGACGSGVLYFKAGNFAFSGQASAVAVTTSASANANYRSEVAVFTAAKGGLMFEASIGGHKFSYEPLGKKK